MAAYSIDMPASGENVTHDFYSQQLQLSPPLTSTIMPTILAGTTTSGCDSAGGAFQRC